MNIPYVIFFGTLLGAVRHNGFIPWDDDIDVVLLREDYERFIKDAQPLLGEHIFLQARETDPGYPRTYAKLRDSRTTYVETYFSDRDMNHGICMDIFPLDGVPSNVLIRTSGWITLSVIGQLTFLRALNIRKPAISNVLRGFSKFIPLNDDYLIDLYSKLISLIGTRRSRFVGHSSFPAIPIRKIVYPIDWIKDTTTLDFEGHPFPVPRDYDSLLRRIYGDYMTPPPESDRSPNHLVEMISVTMPYDQLLKKRNINGHRP